MPYRILSPPEADPLDVEHPYAEELRKQQRRARRRFLGGTLLVFVAIGFAKVASSGPPTKHRVVSEATRVAGARAAIAGARDRAANEQRSFEAGVRDAIGRGVVARPDLGACPYTLPAALALSSPRHLFPILTIEHADLREVLPSQAVHEVLVDVGRAEAHLSAGRYEEAAIYGRALDRAERFTYEVVLVANAAKKPLARSGSEYEPGEIQGRAYLYDFARKSVICAGDIQAKSSRAIGYTFSDRVDAPARLGAIASMGDAIDEDIRVQTERAIVDAIRFRAGPPLDSP